MLCPVNKTHFLAFSFPFFQFFYYLFFGAKDVSLTVVANEKKMTHKENEGTETK